MPNYDLLLTDDAVAERLISEADDDSSRCSLAGLESRRARPENKPKPNTRFLRNIIRTTENHNAALLAKEAAESQARLRELRETELRERRRHRPEPHEVRRRQMRDISAILHGSRGKKPIAVSASSSAGGISGHSLSRRKGDRSDGEDDDVRGERRSREYRSDSSRRKARRASHSRERDRRRERHRSCSPDRGQRHRHRSRRERSPLDGDGHKKYDRRQGSSHERHTGGSSRSKSPRDYNRKRPADDGTGDSDSLAEIIGPLPPSLPTRGRGNTAHASGIDARFLESYDPTSDVTHQDLSAEAGSSTRRGDRGGWDDMAEAFRDRQKWKAQGAERLRAAGFTETQIQKWERGPVAGRSDGDTHPDDFCWSKKGELRQWDRGKTVNPDGSVSTGPDWAK